MSNPTCSFCTKRMLSSDRDRHLEMCEPCSAELGVMPLPPPRRPPVPCRCCKGQQFIRAIPREVTKRAAPMTVTFMYRGPTERMLSPLTTPIDVGLGLGLLEVYVCKQCGLVEWFCIDPEHIAIGPSYMTEELDYEATSSGPYR